MKVKDCMTKNVICVGAEEAVSVAARLMARYNVGTLPVRGADGRIRGILTDRDVAVRCVAAEKAAGSARVADIMSNRVVAVSPETDVLHAADVMAKEQIRRLPVLEDGHIAGMLTVGDLSRREQFAGDAAECLGSICSGVRRA